MRLSASPRRFAWLAIAAAIATIALKGIAAYITGSVSLLSDALESTINLTTAIITLVVLFIVARPPDEDHTYGHGKAEYLSSGAEGGLILVAAISIIFVSVRRLLDPRPVENIAVGLAVTAVATIINLVVAQLMIRAGRHERSIALEADGHHLMTDVLTSVGVLLGVAVVLITGIERLDPVIAIVFAGNIAWTGVRLVRRSAEGLMDSALPEAELRVVQDVLARYQAQGVQHHALRSRQAGARSFVSFHLQVPGNWSVQQGHDMVEQIEADLRRALPHVSIFSHLEPVDDPRSWDDIALDRPASADGAATAAESERPPLR